MILFLFILVIIFVASKNAGQRLMEQQKTKKDYSTAKNSIIVEDIPRFCPPHQWSWVDVVDKEGTKRSERMVCSRCGPLSNSQSDNK